ncbi:MAG: beta-lactamase family protein [Flavobacteriaceae bacterium]|nr:beta-lactamase family protein [Flavobacteriaceae bacterium]
MRHFILSIGLLFVLIIVPNAFGQGADLSNLESQIDSLVPKQVNDSTPGLVIGVVKNGELIFGKGYGKANLTYDIPNDMNLVYNIGSVSKQFLGYAFAMLHSEGKLNIDDPVNKYLNDWPEFEHKVTLRHLLTHTSGYREAYTMSNLVGRYVGQDRLTREECLNVVRRQPQLEFVPGSRFTYNSTAWVILAELMEKVTETPADIWVENNILKPLDMNDTQIESYVGEVITNAAESYSNSDQGYKNEESNRAIFGAAEVYTSVNDLVKWINNYKTSQIGGEAVRSVFLDPFILNDGSDSEYALGIGVSEYRGLKRYRHTGGHEAFSSQLSYYPDEDLGIIVISNFGGRASVSTSAIASLFLGDKMTQEEKLPEIKPVNMAADKLKSFTGMYVTDTMNDTVELTMNEEGSLIAGGQFKLIPVNDKTFRIEDWNGEIEIEMSSDSEANLKIIQGGSVDSYKRFASMDNGSDTLTSYEGRYWSDELETYYTLKLVENTLKVNHRWIGEIELSPVAQDIFRGQWGTIFSFTRDNENQLTGFNINSGRTLNVYFERKN